MRRARLPFRGRGNRVVLAALSILASALAGSGCVEINGGAVEVSWAIFARDGRTITDCSCANPQIAFVRLQLVSESNPGSQPCTGNEACRFSCGRKTGATPFTIPAGQYLMSVVPVDSSGTDLPALIAPGVASVQSPPPESRAVVRGQPTELESFMLEADCGMACDRGGIFNPCSGS